MPRVVFTPNLRCHVDCASADVPGRTVREALERVFAEHPRLRGYILDDQGHLRRHMSVFVNGDMARDLELLSAPVDQDSVIHLLQALSGG